MREGQHSRLRRSLVRRCVPTCPSRQAAQAAWLVRPGCPLARHGARHGARQGDPAWGRGTGDGKATESCGASGARGRLALQPRRRPQPEGRCSAELGSRWGRMGSCHDIRWCLRHFWACEELGGVSACVWCQNSSWLLLPLSPQRAPRSAGRCPPVPAQGGRRGREASTARSGSRPRSQPRVSRAHVPTNAPHTPRTRTRTHMYVRTQTWSLAQSLQASQRLRGHHVPSAQPAACPTPCPGCWWPHTYATRPEACARPALEWLPLRMK